MVRRSVGFVSKKAHRKSRGGCFTCKKKKVKCDEIQPICGYCSRRDHICEYVQDDTAADQSPSSVASSSTSLGSADHSRYLEKETDFNDTALQIPSWLIPAAPTSTEQLTCLDHELLHHYKTDTWRSFAIREDAIIHTLHRDSVPQLSVSHPYLLYALLSIAASHSNALRPSKQVEQQALIYRQKTFQMYTEALTSITAENYEAILVTATFLLALIVPPAGYGPEYDEEYLEWIHSILKLSEGLRILASLRWAQGIEKLSIYPLICRELRTLPPPPLIRGSAPDAPIGPLGTTPEHPNPPPTYSPRQLQASPLFLPPSLMQLLRNLLTPCDFGPIDLHRGAIVPVFHALSPIFLSLYYYHLNQDFYVRNFVLPSFLMPDFLQLTRDCEPRALVLVAWWYAMTGLVHKGWWVGTRTRSVVEAIGRVIHGRDAFDPSIDHAFAGALRIVELNETEGREAAARSIFQDWDGVYWEDGPMRADQWELDQLLDLGDVDVDEVLGRDTVTADELDMANLDIQF